MKQGKYTCDGGCIVVQIGKRNFIHYNNGVGDGEYEVFEFESRKEFDEYCRKYRIQPNSRYKGLADFYRAKVLDYDCCGSCANTLFTLNGRYRIYINTDYNYRHGGDVYFVKA